jgi:hypothetical protein
MRLGGEVQYRGRLVQLEEAGYERGVADIAMDEGVIGAMSNGSKVLGIARVGKLIQVDQRARLAVGIGLGKPVEDEVRADKTGPSGDKNWSV